jgi:hypothetical protein
MVSLLDVAIEPSPAIIADKLVLVARRDVRTFVD